MAADRRRRALVSGITGQDGSYLAEYLLASGYEVHGIIRRASSFNTDRIDHLLEDTHASNVRLIRHYGDLTDGSGLRRVVDAIEPDEIYHLGAQSHVRVSFDQPEYTGDVVGLGSLRLFEAVRDYMQRSGRHVKIYNAGSSEMFGASPAPQSESTSFHPRSPYGVGKVTSHWYAVNYREAYGMFICNGILFNHESPRRGETFVSRKVTRAVGRIKLGLQDKLYLGNLHARRDWGYARDYVTMMWKMLQQPQPDDYVIATGESHTVQELVEIAFAHLDLDWRAHVEIDPTYYRPSEVDHLEGDCTKAREQLGWSPSVSFHQLIGMMVDHDLELARQEVTLTAAGHKVPSRGLALI